MYSWVSQASGTESISWHQEADALYQLLMVPFRKKAEEPMHEQRRMQRGILTLGAAFSCVHVCLSPVSCAPGTHECVSTWNFPSGEINAYPAFPAEEQRRFIQLSKVSDQIHSSASEIINKGQRFNQLMFTRNKHPFPSLGATHRLRT